jgi:hypothetical protein
MVTEAGAEAGAEATVAINKVVVNPNNLEAIPQALLRHRSGHLSEVANPRIRERRRGRLLFLHTLPKHLHRRKISLLLEAGPLPPGMHPSLHLNPCNIAKCLLVLYLWKDHLHLLLDWPWVRCHLERSTNKCSQTPKHVPS